MRVGLRRLRAALSLFKNLLQGSDFRKLKVELVWLGEQLGPARDYDVLVSKTVGPLRSSHPDKEEFAALENDFDSRCKAGLAAAKAAVESERYRRILFDTALWLFDGHWRNNSDALETSLRKQPIELFAKQELSRRIRKISKRIRKLRTMDPRRRHKLRIAVKKVRYAREFFESLRPDGKGKQSRSRAQRSAERPRKPERHDGAFEIGARSSAHQPGDPKGLRHRLSDRPRGRSITGHRRRGHSTPGSN